MAGLEEYLATFSPMRRAKARSALQMVVRYNSGEYITRHALIERKVASGAVVNKGALKSPDGTLLSVRDITATGLNYATYLASE